MAFDLSKLEPQFAQKVTALLARMQARGYPNLTVNSTWRSAEKQAGLVASGATNAKDSFHTVTDAQGNPAALAIDIGAYPGSWSDKTEANAKFFWTLGQEAEALGLVWGGRFSKSNEWARYGLGWDPGHVQAYEASVLSRIRSEGLASVVGSYLPSLPVTTNGVANAISNSWRWLVPFGVLGVTLLAAAILVRKKRRLIQAP